MSRMVLKRVARRGSLPKGLLVVARVYKILVDRWTERLAMFKENESGVLESMRPIRNVSDHMLL